MGGMVWLTLCIFMRVWRERILNTLTGTFGGLCLVDVWVFVVYVSDIGCHTVCHCCHTEPSLIADYVCVAPCRPEEELWAGATGAGGAPRAGSAAAVSPPRRHASCRGKPLPPLSLLGFLLRFWYCRVMVQDCLYLSQGRWKSGDLNNHL